MSHVTVRRLLSALLLFVLFGAAAPAGAQEAGTDPPAPGTPVADEATEDADEPEAAEAVQGRLSYRDADGDQVPVEDAEIAVTSVDGAQVAVAVTDEDGNFAVGLPGPGAYVATLDVETLPEGISLRNPENQALEVNLVPNQSRNLLFALVEGEGGLVATGPSVWDRAARLLASGVIFGLIIAISAVGLSLIFGTTGLVNFAHGELVTFGGLLAYLFNVTFELPFLVATVAAVALATVAGALLDRGFWRPLRRRGTGLIALLVISIGLGVLLRYIFVFQFGGGLRALRYSFPWGVISLGPITLTAREVFTMGVSITVLVAVALVLQRTAIGKAMRAVADNRDLAESSGIDVQRVINVVWGAGAGLAALGGVLLGMAEQVGWLMGFQLLLLMFAGVVLGGLGTAYGALVGSLVVGIFIQLSTLVIPSDLKNVGALLMLIVILVIRPEGILGQSERIG